MSKPNYYTLFNAAAPRAIASSTNASPITITTSAAHGYSTGDKVTIIGHLVNTAANGQWTITVVDADEFTLDGSVGNGVGVATGTHSPKGKNAFCQDFQHAVVSLDTDGGGDAAMTVKFVGSIQETPPDYARPQGPTNQYEFIQVIDLEDSTAVDGDTGLTLAAADANRMFEVNVNGLRWLSALITAGTAGEVTVKARLFED
jgi:hypothetical protein